MNRIMVLVAIVLLLVPLTALGQDFCKGNFDYDKDVDGSDASTFKQDFGRSALLDPCPPDGPAPVEKSWQSPSYEAYDDGWYHMGIRWDTRFTDNGNGTVTDNLTGLIWLQNANCFADETWNSALTACNTLSSGTCGLTDGSIAGDWRLPNIKELLSLIDFDFYFPPIHMSYFFNNIQTDTYWSSTSVASSTGYAWTVQMADGAMFSMYKTYSWYVWPVRGGH